MLIAVFINKIAVKQSYCFYNAKVLFVRRWTQMKNINKHEVILPVYLQIMHIFVMLYDGTTQ